MAGCKVACALLALAACCCCCLGEKFTSLKDMEKILVAESSLGERLEQYIGAEESRLQRLRDIASDFKSHSAEALVDPDRHLGNPVSAFRLVKRFTTDWDNIYDSLLKSNAADRFSDGLQEILSLFPDNDDLIGAATAVTRLQDTYALPTEYIADGGLRGAHEAPVMTASECFELGRMAYNSGDYYHAVLWMEHALEKMKEDCSPETQNEKAALLDYLSYAMYQQGNPQRAYNLTLQWLQLEPGHERAQSNVVHYERILKEREEEKRQKEEAQTEEEPWINQRTYEGYRGTKDFADYEALCRGEDTQYRPVEHHLYCRYKKHHPYFILRPLKEEIMNFDPFIAVYHNAMLEEEMEKVKELAGPKLHRSGVFVHAGDDQGNIYTKYRTSKSAWIHDHEDFLINRISLRTSAMVNLTLETVEQWQVLNYGIGGHYEPHFDFVRKDEVSTFSDREGNRILTAIYYLSDVQAGGYTVFPDLGVKVKPEKGACAVWYNLMRSGDGDYRTKHAGCPVLQGVKWVSNKWFHERGQDELRPCSLSEFE